MRKKIDRRYVVLKIADIDRYLNVNDRHTINLVSGVIERKRKEEGRLPMAGLFIDRRWPIHNHIEGLFLHWLNNEPGDGQLAYIRRLEAKLKLTESELHRQQDENLILVGENNRLRNK